MIRLTKIKPRLFQMLTKINLRPVTSKRNSMFSVQGISLDFKNPKKTDHKGKLFISRNKRSLMKNGSVEAQRKKENKVTQSIDRCEDNNLLATNPFSSLLVNGNKTLLNRKPKTKQRKREIVFNSMKIGQNRSIYINQSINDRYNKPFKRKVKKSLKNSCKIRKINTSVLRKSYNKSINEDLATENISKKTKPKEFFMKLSKMEALIAMEEIKNMKLNNRSLNKTLLKKKSGNTLEDLLKISTFLRDQDDLFKMNYGGNHRKSMRMSL
ncbi:unnamed protein product [Moneuplotes crassus]|uniref:Uncharacterized protein n=1 Tax=Euplotes crassus TaxID=5936 RepID=A0AAD1XG70_EUPCR|nr:unnamed protein product [Moneuplotes crassus]